MFFALVYAAGRADFSRMVLFLPRRDVVPFRVREGVVYSCVYVCVCVCVCVCVHFHGFITFAKYFSCTCMTKASGVPVPPPQS